MGLLDYSLDNDLPINDKNLKEFGFYKSGWGKPDSCITTGKHRGEGAKWNEEHMFWQYNERLDRNVFAVMWYFPKNFEGYCTAFNWHGKNPAGGLYITIDASDMNVNNWYDTMQVESMDAIKCALVIIKNKYNESKKR